MRARLKKTPSHEIARFLYRQAVKEPHYPPPPLEQLAFAPFSAIEKAGYRQGLPATGSLTMPGFVGLGALLRNRPISLL
jgi:hypothetical protein